MPANPRREIVVNGEIGVYHCIARCVRRAFLCGVDHLTGKDHEHRKQWIRDRLEHLASVFAIEVCGYAVMSNHIHVVLRVRPDLAQNWTDAEVAIQWRRLYPLPDPATGLPAEPSEHDLSTITSNPARVAELRDRLASLSWFMRCLSERIARAANREDKCTGRFWEGRFKSQALLDEAAILACSIYVDLNPIRAGVADTPEQSEFTSAFDRIRSLQAASNESTATGPGDLSESHSAESSATISPGEPRRSDAWLCEMTLREGPSANPDACSAAADVGVLVIHATAEGVEPPSSRSRFNAAARVSNQGLLPIELAKYLSLLDWTGRELRARCRGTIPGQLATILERLGLNSDGWLETVRHFGRWFKRAAGHHDSMAALAERSGRQWFQSQRAAAIAFR